MRIKASTWLCLTLLSTPSLMAPEPTSAMLTAPNFGKLHALIKPQPKEERWAEIPWMTNLWDARQRAAAEGKPILLWETDGHPLGCT